MACVRVSKKNSKVSRSRAIKIIEDVRKDLKEKYKFEDRLVGSAGRNTIIKDSNGVYDLDYQLRLTKNSKEYKTNKLNDPTKIKGDFMSAFNKAINAEEKAENSTTAITVRKYKTVEKKTNEEIYSIDFVILRSVPENKEIIRRNNKIETITKNEFTWNELPKVNDAFDKFKDMIANEKQDVCDNYIIPRKCQEKQKDQSDESIISSSRIFIEEVNNYG